LYFPSVFLYCLKYKKDASAKNVSNIYSKALVIFDFVGKACNITSKRFLPGKFFHGNHPRKSAFSDDRYKLVNVPAIVEIPPSPLSIEGDSRVARGVSQPLNRMGEDLILWPSIVQDR
jgi:hypothetical protein